MKLETLLTKIGKEHKLENLELDSQGFCHLFLDNFNEIIFERSLEKDIFFIWSVVGIIPIGKEKEWGIAALKGNLFGIETGKASLGFHPDTRALVLFLSLVEESFDFPTFEALFHEFVSYQKHWSEKLSREAGNFVVDHMKELRKEHRLDIFFA